MSLKQSIATNTYVMTLQRNLSILLKTQHNLSILNLLEPNCNNGILIEHIYYQNKKMMEWFYHGLNNDISQSLIIAEPSIKELIENDVGVIEKKYVILKTYTENIKIVHSAILCVADTDSIMIDCIKESILSKLRHALTMKTVPMKESMMIIDSIKSVHIMNSAIKIRRSKFTKILIKLLHDMFMII